MTLVEPVHLIGYCAWSMTCIFLIEGMRQFPSRNTTPQSDWVTKHQSTCLRLAVEIANPGVKQRIIRLTAIGFDTAYWSTSGPRTLTISQNLSFRTFIVAELHKAKMNYFSKLIKDSKGNSSKMWKHINCLTNSNTYKHQRIKGLRISDKYISDNASIANEFSAFFIESVQELFNSFKPVKPTSITVRTLQIYFTLKR